MPEFLTLLAEYQAAVRTHQIAIAAAEAAVVGLKAIETKLAEKHQAAIAAPPA